jgi:uncharacterized protein YjbI with pentapeptide repeats
MASQNFNIGPRANLRGANLEGRDLREAFLKEANLREAHLREADLRRAILEKAHLEEADLSFANLEGAYLKKANLTGANLRGVILTGAHLQETDFEGAILSWTNLRGADLTGADLTYADLTGADLTDAILNEEELSEIQKIQIRQSEHSRRILEEIRAISDISNLKQRQNQLGRLELRGANLNYANLEGAHLEEANLTQAFLQGAYLRGAHLERANLSSANLERAHLEEAHLEGAYLIGAFLEEADLRRAFLQRARLDAADLREAHLERAFLQEANLGGALLIETYLTEANLERAHLEEAHLEEANLTRVDLTNADLRGAYLRGANFTEAILTNVILSDEQRAQIAASNQARQNQIAASVHPSSLALLNQSISASADNPALTFSRNQYGRNITVINVPPELLKPKNNSGNSFMPLYEQVMVIDLDSSFRFQFQGQNAHDLTGLTRIVFDKLLPVYTKLFFRKSGEFMLLKENVVMVLLNQHTNQIIKLAKAANAQIQLEINPELIEFLSLKNPPESIATRQNFNTLYAKFKSQINRLKEGDPNLNVSNYLINKSLKPQINAAEGKLETLNRALKEEILFRKTLSDFGFTSIEQYHNMAVFIKNFWNISNRNKITVQKQGRDVRLDLFVPKLEFDIESFKRRIKIIRQDPREVLDLSRIPPSLNQIYPAFGPLLEYILNPTEVGNENRKTFVKYATGTEYSPAEITILLTDTTMQRGLYNGQALYGHSCSSQIDLYMAPRNYNGVITGNNINTQLKATVSNKSNIRVAER